MIESELQKSGYYWYQTTRLKSIKIWIKNRYNPNRKRWLR